MNMQNIETRRSRRRLTYLNASLVFGAAKHAVWVRDISAGGAQIFFERPIAVGQRVIFTTNGKQRGAVVRWVDHPLAGIEFEGGPGIDLAHSNRLSAREKRHALRIIAKQESKTGLSGLLRRLSGRR